MGSGSFLGWTTPEDRGWWFWGRSVKLHCIAGEGVVLPRFLGSQRVSSCLQTDKEVEAPVRQLFTTRGARCVEHDAQHFESDSSADARCAFVASVMH